MAKAYDDKEIGMRNAAVRPKSIAEAKEVVQRACHRMVTDGLVIGSAGNVSVRMADEALAGMIVVSAGGVPYDELGPEDHPVVSIADGQEKDGIKASSEIALHIAIMRHIPWAGAVVHTHSRFAAAFSVARQDIPFVCNENAATWSDRILVTRPYAAPGSAELGGVAIEAFDRQPGSRAVLLANHGVVALGDTAEEAGLLAAQVEWAANIAYLARTLGGETILSPEEQDWIGRNYGKTFARETA
jgi:L-fuculose-phosphate aldolase